MFVSMLAEFILPSKLDLQGVDTRLRGHDRTDAGSRRSKKQHLFTIVKAKTAITKCWQGNFVIKKNDSFCTKVK